MAKYIVSSWLAFVFETYIHMLILHIIIISEYL